jgi:hypothetical protein
MDKARLMLAAVFFTASPLLAHAQGFSADYALWSGSNWFGQVSLSQAPMNQLTHATNDAVNLGGGYRFADGQSLSLQVSRARGPLPRLGLAVSYDWPRYFVRFSYDQGLNLAPQDNLRFSAGVRF